MWKETRVASLNRCHNPIRSYICLLFKTWPQGYLSKTGHSSTYCQFVIFFVRSESANCIMERKHKAFVPLVTTWGRTHSVRPDCANICTSLRVSALYSGHVVTTRGPDCCPGYLLGNLDIPDTDRPRVSLAAWYKSPGQSLANLVRLKFSLFINSQLAISSKVAI